MNEKIQELLERLPKKLYDYSGTAMQGEYRLVIEKKGERWVAKYQGPVASLYVSSDKNLEGALRRLISELEKGGEIDATN
jgi:hypothetical protein